MVEYALDELALENNSRHVVQQTGLETEVVETVELVQGGLEASETVGGELPPDEPSHQERQSRQ